VQIVNDVGRIQQDDEVLGRESAGIDAQFGFGKAERAGFSHHERGPGKTFDPQHVMQKLDEFVGMRPDMADGIGLFDGGEVVAHLIGAAARRRDDGVVFYEIPDEQGFRVGRFPARYWSSAGHNMSARAGNRTHRGPR